MIADGILPRSVTSELFAGSRLPYFRSSERNSNPGLASWPSFQIEDSRWSPVTSRCITSRWCTGSSCRCAAHAHSVVAASPNSRVHPCSPQRLAERCPTPLHAHTYLRRFRNVGTNRRVSYAAFCFVAGISLLVFRCRQLSNCAANKGESNQLMERRKLAELLGYTMHVNLRGSQMRWQHHPGVGSISWS
jgi:hypothetical protein